MDNNEIKVVNTKKVKQGCPCSKCMCQFKFMDFQSDGQG